MNGDQITLTLSLRKATYASSATTSNATGVDVSGYTGRIQLCQNVGTIGGTSPTFDGKIQESSDNSTWSDVTGGAFTQVTASDNTQTIYLQTRALKRYIRHVMTTGGTSPTGPYTVALVGQKTVN